jgi:hypothetical protein
VGSTKASFKGYCASLVNPNFAPMGFKVAVVVGTILFAINHGYAVLAGTMTLERWVSVLLTYCAPYLVNIHGQYTSELRQKK